MSRATSRRSRLVSPAAPRRSSSSRWRSTRARATGIAKGMPVVSGGALVGRMVRVTSTKATIRLLTDPGLNVGVRLSRTGDVGVATGDGDELGPLSRRADDGGQAWRRHRHQRPAAKPVPPWHPGRHRAGGGQGRHGAGPIGTGAHSCESAPTFVRPCPAVGPRLTVTASVRIVAVLVLLLEVAASRHRRDPYLRAPPPDPSAHPRRRRDRG